MLLNKENKTKQMSEEEVKDPEQKFDIFGKKIETEEDEKIRKEKEHEEMRCNRDLKTTYTEEEREADLKRL